MKGIPAKGGAEVPASESSPVTTVKQKPERLVPLDFRRSCQQPTPPTVGGPLLLTESEDSLGEATISRPGFAHHLHLHSGAMGGLRRLWPPDLSGAS